MIRVRLRSQDQGWVTIKVRLRRGLRKDDVTMRVRSRSELGTISTIRVRVR
jgi:hypothetical protein